MSGIYVVYFSSTGNTEKMAGYVAEGIESKGKKAILTECASARPEKLIEEQVFALGCPACGSEELDETMESLMDAISGSLKGKKIGLFGSCGWGDGDYMREWEKRITESGAQIVTGQGIIAQEDPESVTEELKNLGALLAEG